MSARRLVALAGLGSAALLLGAFAFQALGYAPCKLCLWQRWPHAAALLIAAVALVVGPLALAWLGALAVAVTAGIGGYHVGVEQGWWAGPTSCSGAGGGLAGLSGADLLSTDGPSDVVMCDEIAWQLLGISMAGWNAILSLVLVAVWIAAARRA